MYLKFWGVRGSIATPEQCKLGYGGNTTCLEVRDDDDSIIIFDAGCGIRYLSNHLLKQGKPLKLNIMFTHYHVDHTQGLPFFVPIYQKDNLVNLFGTPKDGLTFKEILGGQFAIYYYPVSFKHMMAQKTFTDLNGGPVKFGKTTVTYKELNHVKGCKGYRIENGGKSIVLATDHEHYTDRDNDNLLELAEGADIFIYDSQYTPEEYENGRVGWGHSTWVEGVKAARKAGVKQLVLFHHDPEHDDQFVDSIVESAQKEYPNTIGARDNLEITL